MNTIFTNVELELFQLFSVGELKELSAKIVQSVKYIPIPSENGHDLKMTKHIYCLVKKEKMIHHLMMMDFIYFFLEKKKYLFLL